MGLQDSDLILVERSNTLYRETYGNRANIDSSDLFLVERGGTLYKCTYANWSSANSTDLILVEANSTTNGRVVGQLYKETKANWPTSTYADIHSANYAVPSSKLTFTYENTGDNDTDFSVFEVQVEVTDSGSSSLGHLYIGVRNTATYYYGDLPIAGIQILQSNGTTFRYDDEFNGDWNFAFGNEATGATLQDPARGYNDWFTTDSDQGSDGIITDEDQNPGDPTTGFEFFDIQGNGTAASGERRMSYTTSGTVSSWVGAEKGISTSSYPANMSVILSVGTENIAQFTPTDPSSAPLGGYIFNETSGAGNTPKQIVWFKGPEYTDGSALMTLYNGDRIRICYFGGANGQNSTNGLQTTDCIYLRWQEE